jgi:molybdopterin molybdotransferase
MPELFTVLTPTDALRKLFDHLRATMPAEFIDTASALKRVLAEALVAPSPLPSFARSTMDGYAVRAADTYGATEALPAYLIVSGESPMGQQPSIGVEAG